MAKNKLVSVNILTYNGQDLIEPCLKSVLRQSYPNVEILVIDNASKDESVKRTKAVKYKAQNMPIRIVQNETNVGFAAGHNQGIRESQGDYVLCLNQDVILDKDFIKKTIETMEVDDKIGAVQGKLYKSKIQTNTLDTTGLLMFKNRRVVARGQGEEDKNQYKRGEIFGVDGAAPLYRRQALEDVKLSIFRGRIPEKSKFEYFDQDFFCYKEDIDLAWRMRLYGWKAIYEPKAVGYHLRGAGEGAVKTYLEVAKARKNVAKFAKYHSFKNDRLMRIKNELPALFFRHFYRIIIKEIAAWFYVLIFERYTWKAIKELFKQAPNAWRKRKIIMSRKRVGAKDIKKWIF